MRVGSALILALAASALQAAPADRFADVEVVAHPVAGNVHMLTGAGGNIGVSHGPDGTLIVDDQFGPLAERILGAVQKLGGKTPKLVLNTHYHGDHTGSNAFFGREGTIIAHHNVRIRLLGQENIERSALPLVTFADRITLHFNDETIEVIHLPNGHTDGDSVVWFKDSNVVHMGDHFFNGAFPYVDVNGGGSIEGFVRNLSTVLDAVPEDIKIIPGHGPLADTATLTRTQDVIRHAHRLVLDGLEAGRTEDAIAAQLDEEYPTWGKGFISAARWVTIVKANAGL